MSLIKWQPFGEFDDAFARLMPSLFGRFCAHRRPRTAESSRGRRAPTSARRMTEYLIRAELPAVKKEDVKVMLDQGMITIQRRTQGREGNQGREVPSCREFPRSLLAQLFGAGQHRRQGHPRRIEGWRADGSSAEDKGGRRRRPSKSRFSSCAKNGASLTGCAAGSSRHSVSGSVRQLSCDFSWRSRGGTSSRATEHRADGTCRRIAPLQAQTIARDSHHARDDVDFTARRGVLARHGKRDAREQR